MSEPTAIEYQGIPMDKFKKDLGRLINFHSIENYCDMPDYLLAEMICNFIKAVGQNIKTNLDWHGCDSAYHSRVGKLTVGETP